MTIPIFNGDNLCLPMKILHDRILILTNILVKSILARGINYLLKFERSNFN